MDEQRRAVKTTRKRADIDPAALADQIQAALGGPPISLLVGEDEAGNAVVSVLPAGYGSPDPEVDADQVLALVDGYRPPLPPGPLPDPVTVLDALSASLTAARTVGDVRDALLTYTGAERARRARDWVLPVRPERSSK